MEDKTQAGMAAPDPLKADAGEKEFLAGNSAKKATWTTPTLTRLHGEETEVQPSFGIVKFLIAGS